MGHRSWQEGSKFSKDTAQDMLPDHLLNLTHIELVPPFHTYTHMLLLKTTWHYQTKWEAVSSFTTWSAQISRIYPKCHGKEYKTSQQLQLSYLFLQQKCQETCASWNCCVTNSSSSRSVRRSKVASTHSFKTLGHPRASLKSPKIMAGPTYPPDIYYSPPK